MTKEQAAALTEKAKDYLLLTILTHKVGIKTHEEYVIFSRIEEIEEKDEDYSVDGILTRDNGEEFKQLLQIIIQGFEEQGPIFFP